MAAGDLGRLARLRPPQSLAWFGRPAVGRAGRECLRTARGVSPLGGDGEGSSYVST